MCGAVERLARGLAVDHKVQQVTVLSAAPTAAARPGEAARAFIAVLQSPPAMPVIMETGPEPIAPDETR